MGFLEKLLDGARVERLPLECIVNTITAPAKLQKKDYRQAGNMPIIDQGLEFIAGYTDGNVKALPVDTYVIFGDHSEHIKYVDFAFVQGADGLKILRPISSNAKYVYYALQNFYQKQLSYKRHWSHAKETLIPIPCPENPQKSLKIQGEFVRILDKFTELTTELKLRKKQYQYYRDKLLTFPQDKVEWKALGEMAKIKHGRDWKKLNTGNIPIYGSGGIMGYVDSYIYNRPTVLIPRKGSITNIFYVDTAFWNVDTIYYTEIDTSKLIPKYLYHFLKTVDLMRLDTGSGRPSLTQAILNKLAIPVPYPDNVQKSLAEQARIVAILDRFETLTNSLQEGLPREITLRQKQYEYYRDMLFNFPKSY